MPLFASHPDAAHIVDQSAVETLDLMGPLIEFLTEPDAEDSIPCTMRGTIPAGAAVPLHSHADPETYIAVSGRAEGLVEMGEDFAWLGIAPGDVFHVPGGAKHAFRNQWRNPAVMVVISTSRIGRFFREVGTPVAPDGRPPAPPSEATIRHFLETAERYGYWNAPPEENARLGIPLPPL